ncbi:MAG: AMP-binding protein [Pseudorhodoplanes sp.]|uniref:AMP-binding protein n=1 Tax=Pseudorhodoplanes sp. TaxID=1934341 RepID=UPI003D0D1DA3
MQTAFELVRRAAQRTPAQIAIVEVASGKSIRFDDLIRRVEGAAAGFLSLGLRPGQRVAVVLANSIDAGVVILALHRAGLVPALMNPRLKPSEIAALIGQGEIAAAVIEGDRALQDALREQFGGDFIIVRTADARDGDISFSDLVKATAPASAQNAQPEDSAFIFYTSGTTGLPKGAVIPQRAAESRMLFMCTQCGHTCGPHNRVCGLMPLYHVIGFFAVFLKSLALNGTLYLMRDFVPPNVIGTIRQEKLTSIFVTPTHLDALISAGATRADLSSLEIVVFAGSLMPDRVLARVRELISGRLVNIYGTTEAMNSLFMVHPTTGTTFVPGFYSEVRVIRVGGSVDDRVAPGEEGELIVSARSDAIFTEYLGRPDVTMDKLNGGWYRTSDAALVRPDGQIEIRGRVDETIISGGENIHPNEVEEVLLAHPEVADCAVIGVPNDRWGQMVTACVVVRNTTGIDDLEAYLRGSKLADFKRPRQYHFLQAIPRNATNKIMRKALLEMLQQR